MPRIVVETGMCGAQGRLITPTAGVVRLSAPSDSLGPWLPAKEVLHAIFIARHWPWGIWALPRLEVPKLESAVVARSNWTCSRGSSGCMWSNPMLVHNKQWVGAGAFER
jgi:hypothetical protein